MKTSLFITFWVIVFSFHSIAQKTDELQNATLITKASFMKEVPSIASQIISGDFKPAENIKKEVNPKKRDGNKVVPGKGLPHGKDPLWNTSNKGSKLQGKEPILTFEAASSSTTPTDPTGAVGPDHFVNAWNSSFRIWDKEGNPLTDAASLGTILPGTLGDPIVLYDRFADRFLITEFYSNGFYVGITQGPDPVNDDWYVYSFPTNSFPDYPKFSIWSDGYYVTANKNSSSAGTSEVVYVMERDKMIDGDEDALMIGFPLTNIMTSGFYSPLGFNANGSELPPVGDAPIVYLQDDNWFGISEDHLKIWNINVDWETPDNSTISTPQEIETEAFDAVFDGGWFSNLPQPSGPDIDALQATIMYMAQYRRFPSHNSVVFNFVVDLDGGDDYAGIRWYELRQIDDGDDWEIHQEGTYSQPDGHSAFSGNMCMDVNGNIGLAFTIVSEDEYPSLKYTGRYATDSLGIMTIEEESIAIGTQSDPSYRYGDYSQMTIDPEDDKTFWSIGEYFTSGSRKNHVGVFKIASDLANDVGISNVSSPTDGILTDTESITVTIKNFGLDDQIDIPVSYEVNGNEIVNETYEGTITSNEIVDYTFETLADLSIEGEIYEITVSTMLTTDEDTINDAITYNVTHLHPNDIGVTQINAPTSGDGLSVTEPITVSIQNYGGLPQSNFDLTYSLNDQEPVTEIVEGPLEISTILSYTFTTTGDFSQIGEHELSVSTSLPGDSDNTNDGVYSIITKEICQPIIDCSSGHGIAGVEIGDIYNISGCDDNGYGDYSELSTTVLVGSNHDLTITTQYGSQHIRVWIDFNDNFFFEADEIIISDETISDGEGFGIHTKTMDLVIQAEANPGEHLMRIKAAYDEQIPDNACEATDFGETEDYTIDIDNSTSILGQSYQTNELSLINEGNNQFKAILKSAITSETLFVSVHNINGQKIIFNRVNNINGIYEYDFDMSFAKPGVYLLRIGSSSYGKIKKFIVE